MEKIKLSYFVSYAHKNDKLVGNFLDHFEDHCGLHRKYQFQKWIDKDIIVGEQWSAQIQEAIHNCHFGLLFLSAPYFNRSYIREKELPLFINQHEILKPIVPVGLTAFDLGGDLLGLESTQIFLAPRPGQTPKFYQELTTKERDRFVQELIAKMVVKLDKIYPSA